MPATYDKGIAGDRLLSLSGRCFVPFYEKRLESRKVYGSAEAKIQLPTMPGSSEKNIK